MSWGSHVSKEACALVRTTGIHCLAFVSFHLFRLRECVPMGTRCRIPVAICSGHLFLWVDHIGLRELEPLCRTFPVFNIAWWYVPPDLNVVGKFNGDNILFTWKPWQPSWDSDKMCRPALGSGPTPLLLVWRSPSIFGSKIFLHLVEIN